MSRRRIRVSALAIVLACAVAGTVVIETGVQSAAGHGVRNTASRGFRIFNKSSHPLRLERVEKIPKVICNGVICVPTHYLVDFEGRPNDGQVLHPGGEPQIWELKYNFDPLGACTYAAALHYKIEGTNGGTLEVTIETCTFSNNSACKVTPAHLGHCTAEPFMGGRKVVFH